MAMMIGFSILLLAVITGYSIALNQALKSHILVVNKVIDQYMSDKELKKDYDQASTDVFELTRLVHSTLEEIKAAPKPVTQSSLAASLKNPEELIDAQINRKETIHIEGFGDVEVQGL